MEKKQTVAGAERKAAGVMGRNDVTWEVDGNYVRCFRGGQFRFLTPLAKIQSLAGVEELLRKWSHPDAKKSFDWLSKKAIADLIHLGLQHTDSKATT